MSIGIQLAERVGDIVSENTRKRGGYGHGHV
jgi:hypothetical protein